MIIYLIWEMIYGYLELQISADLSHDICAGEFRLGRPCHHLCLATHRHTEPGESSEKNRKMASGNSGFTYDLPMKSMVIFL